MILNFNILKLKLKLFLLRTIGRVNRNIPTVELNQQGHNSKDVLIIFPQDEEEFRVAVYTFENLLINKSTCSYFFIIDVLNRNMYSFFNNNTTVLNFKKNLNNEIKINNRRELLNSNFDIIVDLNTTFNYNCSRFVETMPSKLKIGFKSNFSDLFYNVQLDASSANVIESLYKKIYSMVLSV
tara:strand:+ start:101 stop:646 length:546 start_codon:yes stop_codon:yes gene_type:complete